jgi:hypothetical protein
MDKTQLLFGGLDLSRRGNNLDTNYHVGYKVLEVSSASD